MEDKKLHIIQNVGFLYLQHGIRSITMDDVATEFGVSKKTLYQYFNDKEDLISHVIDYFLQNPCIDLKTSSKENAIDGMFKIREHMVFILKSYNNDIEIELKKTYPKLYKKLREAKRQQIFENTIENLNFGISQGLYRKDIEPYFIAKLQVGQMLYTLNPLYTIFEAYELNSIAIFDKMISYHMHAICTEKGIEYYKKQLNRVQNEEKN